MVDPIYEDARTGSAGKPLVGTPGNVLVISPSGTGVQPVPLPAGSVTAVQRVFVAAASGTAVAPSGAFSGSEVFGGVTAVQDAIDAAEASGGSAAYVAETAALEAIIIGTAAPTSVTLSLQGMVPTGVDGESVSVGPPTALGAVVANMGAVPVGGKVELSGFTIASYDHAGAGGFVEKFRQCLFTGNYTDTGAVSQPEFYDCCLAGTLTAVGVNALRTFFVDNISLGAGQAIFRGCTVANAATTVGDDALFDGCLIVGIVVNGGVVPGGLKFRNCTWGASVIVASSSTCDATSELAALAAGVTFADTIFAGSTGQGGNATPLTANVTIDYGGPLRAVGCRNAAALTLTLSAANADITNGLQRFAVDWWSTLGACTVKFVAATIATIPAQVAGSGVRFWFTTDVAGTVITYDHQEQLR